MHSPLVFRTVRLALVGAIAICVLTAAPGAFAADPTTPPTTPTLEHREPTSYRLGAHFELDLGLMAVMRQSAGLAGGVVWGPFRAGLSYTTFLSNSSFGGTPEGFSLRVNHIIGITGTPISFRP